jgi:hypothetical protein
MPLQIDKPKVARCRADQAVSPVKRWMNFFDFLAGRIAAGFREAVAPNPVVAEVAKPKWRRKRKRRRGC